MVRKVEIPSVARAKNYVQDNMAFTTDPVDLQRWMKEGQPVNFVDRHASEDHAEGHISSATNPSKDQ